MHQMFNEPIAFMHRLVITFNMIIIKIFIFCSFNDY